MNVGYVAVTRMCKCANGGMSHCAADGTSYSVSLAQHHVVSAPKRHTPRAPCMRLFLLCFRTRAMEPTLLLVYEHRKPSGGLSALHACGLLGEWAQRWLVLPFAAIPTALVVELQRAVAAIQRAADAPFWQATRRSAL